MPTKLDTYLDKNPNYIKEKNRGLLTGDKVCCLLMFCQQFKKYKQNHFIKRKYTTVE